MSRQSAALIVACLAACSPALAGCASSGATPAPFPRPAPPGGSPAPVAGVPPSAPTAVPPRPADIGYVVTGTALALRGTPYRNGGADPSGFDCSGFVSYVFGQNGVKLPRTVVDLYRTGQQVNGAIEPGDLVFFATVAPGASHVGIAIGGDEFVHAPSSTGEVRVERMSAAYWSTRFVGARRVL
jgi:cell wall-associated NlpC family hydrolase